MQRAAPKKLQTRCTIIMIILYGYTAQTDTHRASGVFRIPVIIIVIINVIISFFFPLRPVAAAAVFHNNNNMNAYFTRVQ